MGQVRRQQGFEALMHPDLCLEEADQKLQWVALRGFQAEVGRLAMALEGRCLMAGLSHVDHQRQHSEPIYSQT